MLASGNDETRKSRFWAFDRDERPWRSDAPLAAWYQFILDRKGILPSRHLMDYQGWMSANGYAGFEEQYRAGRIKVVICMAYVGGKFVDVSKLQGSHNADQAIQRTSQLCAIKKMKRGSPLKQLIMVRQVTAKVIL